MTTAAELIDGSLRLIGQLAEGETPSAPTAQDALRALNQMIDSWNTERLSVFNTQDQIFNWLPGLVSQTLGPTGDFVGNRPVSLDDSTYFRDPATNVSFGIKIINQQQYNGIAVKTVTSTYPQVIWINPSMPDMEFHIYPVPTRVLEWHFVSIEEIRGLVNLATDIILPPGYVRAFRFNLAVEFANEFGVEPSPQTARIAMTSKRNLKRINQDDGVMSMPYPLIAQKQRFNIYTGNY